LRSLKQRLAGPSSVTDPVGYARTQVRALRDVHITEAKLHSVIDHLADAYAEFAPSKGGAAAKAAVAAASAQLTTLCPQDDDS
jgi:truncated hemoglobin YjbI